MLKNEALVGMGREKDFQVKVYHNFSNFNRLGTFFWVGAENIFWRSGVFRMFLDPGTERRLQVLDFKREKFGVPKVLCKRENNYKGA